MKRNRRLTPAALGRIRAIALVVRPASERREQESAKASFARLHKPKKIAAKQMGKKSLHIVGGAVVITSALTQKNVERPPIGARLLL